MKLIFDIETDNYLESCTKIHCISAQDYDTGKVYEFRPKEIKKGLQFLKDADILIGHNILDFDIRAIKKLYPKWKTDAKLFDTLIAAKFVYPDIKDKDFRRLRKVMNKPQSMRTAFEKEQMRNIGKHSLEAYGLRLGEYKGKFGKEVGFDEFSEEMMEYCTQDVKVNTKLYHKILSTEPNLEILDLEFEAKEICLEQQEFGFKFNIDKAYELKETLEAEQLKLQDEIESILGGPFIIPLEVKVPKRDVNYQDVLRGSERAGCPFTKIKVKPFNPTSRHDLSTRLIERCGWKPRLFGKDGKPTLDEEVLSKSTDPIMKKVSKIFTIQKRLGMLSSGNNAWIKFYDESTGCIHGKIDTLGTATHRCTHSRPNLGQIPSVRSAYGKECRSLFTVPDGFKLFGTDAAGLELRMLAHYMFPFDDGAYADIILNGDIHTTNQEAAGLDTRNMAKTFMYAKIYGSGIENLAKVCGMTKKEMKTVVNNFNKNLPALKKLTDAVKEACKYRGYVKSLDGRRIPVTVEHAALNYLLQSAGAIVCKYWMVEIHRTLKRLGYVSGVDFKQSAYVHDELQIAFDPKKISGEELGRISRESMIAVGEKLKVRMPLDIGFDIGDTYADTH